MVYTEHIEEVRRAVAACGRHVDIVAAVKMQTKETVDELMRVAPDFILGENRVAGTHREVRPRLPLALHRAAADQQGQVPSSTRWSSSIRWTGRSSRAR